MRLIEEDTTFGFGKHKGKKFMDILANDYGYLVYLNSKPSFYFSEPARLLLHAMQYAHGESKKIDEDVDLLSEFLFIALVVIEFARKEELDETAWIALRNSIQKVYGDSSLMENSMQKNNEYFLNVLRGKDADFLLSTMFLAVSDAPSIPLNLARSWDRDWPSADAYKKVMTTVHKQTETAIAHAKYLNWGIW